MVKEAHTKQRGSAEGVPRRWKWHYETLALLRDRLIEERNEALSEAAEPIERHSMHQADSATDEFDRELALSRLSAEQDALYEVEAAMRRIVDGTYGVCEQTGKRIPAPRLKAVPWTRFREEVEAQLESTGEITRPHLGALRSLRDETASALAESEPTVEEPEPVLPAELPAEEESMETCRPNLQETAHSLVCHNSRAKGRATYHDPAGADNPSKHGRIRGCCGAGPGGSGQARQVFRTHHELPGDCRGAASASSARRLISHPHRTGSAAKRTGGHA
jgi:RNA polymerase-binding transcription factor DksA